MGHVRDHHAHIEPTTSSDFDRDGDIERRSGVHVASAAGRDVAKTLSGVRFVTPSECESLFAEASEIGFATVSLQRLSPFVRGRLFEALEEACDRMLGEMGAAEAGMGAFGTADERIRDRLVRAHRLGCTGLAIALGSLKPLVGVLDALAPEDSETLRALVEIAKDRPLLVLLEGGDAGLGAFRETVTLQSLLDARPRKPRSPAKPVAQVVMDVMPTVTPSADAVAPRPENEAENVPPANDSNATSSASATSQTSVREARALFEQVQAGGRVQRSIAKMAAREVNDVRDAADVKGPEGEAYVFLPVEKDAGDARVVARLPTVAPKENPWRQHVAALNNARGPQPLGEFERLFAEHYMPLTSAIDLGVDDPRARAAAQEFRHTFARSYSEAFPTFVVTGKRPRLVLDVPDAAGRTARLHGARSVQLLLVDGMRWDVGVMVRDALVAGLGARATLAEESFLLSALPSTTTQQLAGIARGVDGLRTTMLDETDGEAMRGRTSEVVRRIRVGSRDLFKLDIVEARVREADRHVVELLPEIARRVSDAIIRHSATLPPRTLLYVFGDHGFSIDASGRVHQGGASPEEVIVPAFGFLLGMMQ